MPRRTASLARDTRGQSIGIARFFLTLIVGAIAYGVTDLITSPVVSRARNTTSNATLEQGIGWTVTVINLMPVMIAILAMLATIVLAVYQREVLR